MPDVRFSNQYPYTDFHELNLDWVINQVKFWSERVGKSIQTIEKTGTAGLVDTYTITYSDGSTSTFDVTNGNGIASVAKTGTAGLVDTYTITFQDGSTSTFDVTNGTAAIDKTLTLSDYAADAAAVGNAIDKIRSDIYEDLGNASLVVANTDVAQSSGGYLIGSQTGYDTTGFIPIPDGSDFLLTSFSCDVSPLQSAARAVCFYSNNVNGAIVGTGERSYIKNTAYDIPATAKFVRYTFVHGDTGSVYFFKYDIDDQMNGVKNDLLNIPPQNIIPVSRTGWNYITDAISVDTGKYWNGSTIGQPITLGDNPAYFAVKISADNSTYNFTQARFVHALDSSGNLLQVITTAGTTSFNNTGLGAAFLCFTFWISDYGNAIIYKSNEADHEQYTVSGQWIFQDLTADISETTVHLPSHIYCGVGRTIEIYNEQVFLNSDKYHVHWDCEVGIAYARKFSITGGNDDIGNHTLTFEVYDDNYNKILTKTATLVISANSIANTLKVLPIGDSLTNGKEWLSEVPTLSSSKIEYIGTRKTNNLYSEGRSGASATWYVENSSYTYADGSTYVGNPLVDPTSNPFWDGSKFSLNHYITNQSGYVGTPDAVQIMLGTNGLKQTATVVSNIKTMVDTIHSEYATMPIFICTPIFHSNQNGYYSPGGEGYIGVMSNWEYELDRYTVALMNALAAQFDNASYNGFVTIVPTASCMDRENDFGQVTVPVNPRLPSVTEDIPSQYTHPQSAGYLQMADEMYSAYCATLS